MGNQRRHTASLLAVQSPAVRLSVCLSYMQPVGIQGRQALPVSGGPGSIREVLRVSFVCADNSESRAEIKKFKIVRGRV